MEAFFIAILFCVLIKIHALLRNSHQNSQIVTESIKFFAIAGKNYRNFI